MTMMLHGSGPARPRTTIDEVVAEEQAQVVAPLTDFVESALVHTIAFAPAEDSAAK